MTINSRIKMKFYPTFILLRLICLLQYPQVSSLHLHSFSKCSVRSAFFTYMPHSGCTQGILRNWQLFMWFCVETKNHWGLHWTTCSHCNQLLSSDESSIKTDHNSYKKRIKAQNSNFVVVFQKSLINNVWTFLTHCTT